MDLKRATMAGVFIAIGSLIVCGVTARILGLDLKSADPRSLPAAMWICALASTVILVGAGSCWYFKSPRISPSARSGAALGSLYTIAGVAFDAIALAPHKDGFNILLRYFAKPQYWTAFVLILATCTLVGHFIGRKARQRAT